jgi:sigma-B regulation protein RsbU (phosphoserine phosphatase)
MATALSSGSNASAALMPWKDPVQASIPQIRDGYMAAVYYGQRCGGDFYDFLRVSPERVLFGLFDIAGDLKQSRAVVVALQQKFRTSGERLLRPDDANEAESLLELWLELNHAIMAAAGGVRSCPAFLGCYNDDVGTLSYVNSGHTPPLIRDPRARDAQDIGELKATALPLGLFSHSIPDASVMALGPGNTLLSVSRGVVEAKFRGEEYGLERVRDYLHETQFETAHETCVGILSKVQQFMRTAPTHNDVTALSLVRLS